jgi:predicted exporter
VPAERLAADQRLRSALSSVDLRFQVAIDGDTVDDVLATTERLETELHALRDEGLLGDWRAVTQLLPSRDRQQERRQRIPESAVLAARLREAVAGTPLDADAFAPFLDAAAASRDMPPLSVDAYRGGPLASWVESRLIALDDRWVSLVSLVGPDPERLPDRLASRMPEAHWIDLKTASTGLFATFRNGVLRAIGIAALLMALLLALARMRPARIAWLVATVTSALAATAMIAIVLHGQLTIIHLVALLLVFGLGLDYALFFSRTETPEDRRSTLHSVTACTASTTLAFGILGASSVPFLHFIGTTTAVGSLVSFALAFAGSRRPGVN